MDEHYTYPDSNDVEQADDSPTMAHIRRLLKTGAESIEWTGNSIHYAIKRGHFTGARVLLKLVCKEANALECLLQAHAKESRESHSRNSAL